MVHIIGLLFRVDIESVKSVNAAIEAGYNFSMSQTTRLIALTLVLVTVVVEQGLTTVRVKLDGATSEGEVPYVIPLTVTAVT